MTYWAERERLKKERAAAKERAASSDAIAEATDTIVSSIPWTYYDSSSSSAPLSYEPPDTSCNSYEAPDCSSFD